MRFLQHAGRTGGYRPRSALSRGGVNHARGGCVTVSERVLSRPRPIGAWGIVPTDTVSALIATLRAVPRGGPGCGGRGGEHVLFLQLPKHMGSPRKGVQIPKRGRLAGFRDLTKKPRFSNHR